jgi:hypothetical protein
MAQTPEARRLSNQRYYQRTKERQAVQRTAWKAQFVAWFRTLKEGPCADCGKTFHFAAMQFDHIGSDKTANVGVLVARGGVANVGFAVGSYPSKTRVRFPSPPSGPVA